MKLLTYRSKMVTTGNSILVRLNRKLIITLYFTNRFLKQKKQPIYLGFGQLPLKQLGGEASSYLKSIFLRDLGKGTYKEKGTQQL